MADRSLSDRTMIAVGSSAFSVPRIVKRLIETAVATGVTAAVALVVILINSMLTARGGAELGFDTWLAFVRRPDIIATMALTAFVTITTLAWMNKNDRR